MAEHNVTDPFRRAVNGSTRVRFTVSKAAFDHLTVASGEQLPDEVRKAVARGWSVIPQEEQEDGRKKPLVKWKPFQTKPATMRQVQRWYRRWPDELYANPSRLARIPNEFRSSWDKATRVGAPGSIEPHHRGRSPTSLGRASAVCRRRREGG